MKIIYGKGKCNLDYSQNFKTLHIKYRGNIALKHLFFEIIKAENGRLFVVNRASSSILTHIKNEIVISFKESPQGLNELFKYNGTFKILSAKIDKKNITVKTENIDYWNLINSDWNSAGKPEHYRYGYFVGNIPKRTRTRGKRASTKRISTGSRGGY